MNASGDPTESVALVAPGEEHACAIASGQVLCWGDDSFGQIDAKIHSPPLPHAVPTPIVGNAQDMSAGLQHTCAIHQSNGSSAVHCWGSSSYGALGVVDAGTPAIALFDIGSAGGKTPIAVRVSGTATCVLDSAHDVYCAGWNYGQLGAASIGAAVPTPTIVQGLADGHTTEIALSNDELCAVRDDATVVCMGANSRGQLGRGTTTQYESDVRPVLAGPNLGALGYVLHVATAGGDDPGGATCAIVGASSCATSGQVVCWGPAYDWQLGDRSTEDSAYPVYVVAP